jgi:transposase-like protein
MIISFQIINKFKEDKMNCPACNSKKIVKNGSIHNGKQKYLCKECGTGEC